MSSPSWITECPRWVAEAEALTPELKRETVRPVRVVEVVPEENGFQGWKVVDAPDSDPEHLKQVVLKQGSNFIVDFGRHQVGYLRFKVESTKPFNDSPVRFRFFLGEVPAEVAEPYDPYPGSLSRAWLQDVQVDVDELPDEVQLPRRYAFRYVRVEVVDVSGSYAVRMTDFACETVTSAGPDLGTPPQVVADRMLDEVSIHTLRQCMQTVFEDGPKRDRRLWIGDLRLQALTNYLSFRDYPLVKRCLLLFAGLVRADGVISACIFERPKPVMGNAFILDYAALFGPTLLDYWKASGDTALAEDLWPVAQHQMDYCLGFVDPATGLFRDPGNWWLFIDWQAGLHKQACVHAVLIYAARRTAELARGLGHASEAARFETKAERLAAAAREHLRDSETGLYTSGPERQISWATNAWMILAEVPADQVEASSLFNALQANSESVLPAGPYLWHHVVEALLACGREAQADALIRSYWGGMLKRGATTFWEVFDPSEEKLSPYGSHLVNSYCHAWSCTPAYFLRRSPAGEASG